MSHKFCQSLFLSAFRSSICFLKNTPKAGDIPVFTDILIPIYRYSVFAIPNLSISNYVFTYRSTATWHLEAPEDSEGWRYIRIHQNGKNASNQTHYLSLSGFELYGTVVSVVEEALGKAISITFPWLVCLQILI